MYASTPVSFTLFVPYLIALGMLFLGLTYRVIRLRYRYRAVIGTEGAEPLEFAIRGHGNFQEYVPFALILIFSCYVVGMSAWILHSLLGILVMGRACHGYVFAIKHSFGIRRVGVISTLLVYLLSLSLLLIHWIQSL